MVELGRPEADAFRPVEWLSVGDSTTAAAALSRGEVEWLDFVPNDEVPLLTRDGGVTVEVRGSLGSIPIMRFNQLYPPFDNPAIRRAVLGAVSQAGWPDSPKLESLRDAWLDTADPAMQKQISARMRLRLWRDVPYISLGHFVRSTAHRRDLVDLPWGFAAFYGVRRA